jgi:ABC-type Na+ efflux pump permease subunit
MTIRTRKFIGTVLLVLFMVAYALIAMALGASQIVGGPHILQVIYFLLAGLAWIIPAGILIRWMARPDQTES